MKTEPEPIWKTIPEFPEYEISSEGNIRKGSKPIKVYLTSGHSRYTVVYLTKDHKQHRRKVSHLMCEAFGIDRKEAAVIHKNGILTDNSLYNLALATPSAVGKLLSCTDSTRYPVVRFTVKGAPAGSYRSIGACSRCTGIPSTTLRSHIKNGAPIKGYIYKLKREVKTMSEINTEKDVVPKSVYEQVVWERDLAIMQLKDIGKGLGEIMDDIQIIKCEKCKHSKDLSYYGIYICSKNNEVHTNNFFCAYGERKNNE